MALHGADGVPARGLGDYVGSPMYEIIPEHGPAVIAVLLLAIAAWFVRTAAHRGHRWATPFVADYRSLPLVRRFAAWLLLIAGTVHLGLVFGHELSWYSVGYAVVGVAELEVARRLVRRRRWRKYGAIALAGSLVGYAIASMAGEAPDQLGLATKLIELAALAVVLAPQGDRRWRRLGASTATVTFALLVAVGAWVGAFGEGEGGHHLGEVPPPGVLVPDGEDRPATAHEQREAQDLYQATLATAQRYEDPEAARVDGYHVDGMYGLDFHAENAEYKTDGRVLDPARPENLIYAVSDRGPVLIGVMYEIEEIGEPGPAVGGPLTVWHAHDHVCFSLIPPALSGLTSPFGTCPVGSITMPITNEMIHVWTLPGVPERYGDLEDAWLEEYLGGDVARSE
jgi:hypothetical protein